MKTLFASLASALLLHTAHAQRPVYFNIISHNEISDPLDYLGDPADFAIMKNLAVELCNVIISKQAKYNMMCDANFIRGVIANDNGATSSADVLEWAHSSPFIDVDGHNHFNSNMFPPANYNPYNYSDLAYLLDSCGVTLTRKVLGGVTYADTTVGAITMSEDWTQYMVPKQGFTFLNYWWEAEIVWGTASPGHIADYTRFGVWRPEGGASPTQFGTHDPNASLTHIGGGCKEDISYILNTQSGQLEHTTDEVIANIRAIVDEIQTLPAQTNEFYTLNMMVNFRDMPNIPYFADSVAKIIDGIQDYVNQGKIVWSTLAEKYDLWYANHSNPQDHFNFDCEELTLSLDETTPSSLVALFPNPGNGHVEFNTSELCENLRVFDLRGKEIPVKLWNQWQFDLSDVPCGTYFIHLQLPSGTRILRYVKGMD